MKQYTAHEINKRYTQASTIKLTWDNEYRQVFEFCMPARAGYQKASLGGSDNPEFQDRRANLYTSIGEQSASEFVNTMQEVLCPPMAKWISLEAGMRFKEEEREEVNLELDKLCELANEYKNASYFDMAFSEFCYDVFAGTGCMLVLPGNPRQPLTFKAIPLKEYCVTEGANGEVNAVYRKYEMSRELLGQQWIELKDKEYTEEELKKDIQLIECTYYDVDIDAYHYIVVDQASIEILVEREYKTNPFVVLRWNKCAGESYGRGVGITALNDIKTLNLIKEYSLRNFAYNIPPLLVQEDAMLDVEGLELTPFSLNVVPDTTSSIVPLQISTDHNVESYKIQELTMEIKRNTFGNTLPNEGSKQLTATEVNARQMEMRRNLNSVFGRLIVEFQLPLVKRIIDVLASTGIIKKDFNISDIDGLVYKVKINTPIARQLQQGEAQSIIQSASLLLQLDPTGKMLTSSTKVNDMAVYLMNLLGVPPRFVNTKEETDANQQQQAQAQAQAQKQVVEQDVLATNAKDMGKAEANMAEQEAMSQ